MYYSLLLNNTIIIIIIVVVVVVVVVRVQFRNNKVLLKIIRKMLYGVNLFYPKIITPLVMNLILYKNHGMN